MRDGFLEDWKGRSRMKQIGIILAGTVPLVIAVVTGVFAMWELSEAEQSRLEWDKHVRKTEVYVEILESIEGFYESVEEQQTKRENFLKAFRLCELHCPDAVFRDGNAFLDTVAVGSQASEEEQRRALATFRLGLRRDLLPKSDVGMEEFRIWAAK